MHEFKVGDKVKINEKGHRRYGAGWNNPRGVKGKVTRAQNGYYSVYWDDGSSNTYVEGTISLAKIKMLENE